MRYSEIIEETKISPPLTNWSDLQMGVPATVHGWRGSGNNVKLQSSTQEFLGRTTLLGNGVYIAPTPRIAAKYGIIKPVKVILNNPYLLRELHLGLYYS